MAGAKQVILDQLRSGQKLLEMLTADLADAEYFVPAAVGTNHAAWILGHLARTEDRAVAALCGTEPHFVDATHELFRGGSKCASDAAEYPPRGQIDAMFRDARVRTVAALSAFDEGRWEEPAPEGYPRAFFPTAGSIWAMQATHQFWHIGQLTTCRATLKKKPVLV